MILQGKRAAYVTLGCKLNFSETSTIRHSLEEAGTVTVDDDSAADVVVINTCSVTDMAEHKGRQLIRKIIRHHPGACVVVVGCYAQLRPGEIRQIEGVQIVLSAAEKFLVRRRLEEYDGESVRSDMCDIRKLTAFDAAYSFGDRTRSFLKIQDGCDYYCTYCTIPFARGNSRSATISQTLQAARDIATKGVREIILTGVNTGDFGRANGETFLQLLQTLDGVEEIDRFRISSIEPNLLTDEIIGFIADSRRFMPHFHIPLQSGSDEVLKLMHRRYTRDLFAAKVATVRRLRPDAFIGVDVIAGMRGETLPLFEDARQFIDSLDISKLHVFPYSEREGTKALEIPHCVPPEEKHRRVEVLLQISNRKRNQFRQRFIGETRPVLFESSQHNGMIGGFTDNYIRVGIPYKASLANHIIPVRLTPDILLEEE